jgi:hypothetical protein
MITATLINDNPAAWAPGTQHWRTSDNRNFVIECSPTPVPEGSATEMVGETLIALGESFGSTKVILSETTIVECDENGNPIGDTVPEALWTFSPGTSHTEALILAGYEIGE